MTFRMGIPGGPDLINIVAYNDDKKPMGRTTGQSWSIQACV